MITVGYGDIHPVNRIERIFAIITTLVACGIFGYMISEVGTIFKTLTYENKLFKQNMVLLVSHM